MRRKKDSPDLISKGKIHRKRESDDRQLKKRKGPLADKEEGEFRANLFQKKQGRGKFVTQGVHVPGGEEGKKRGFFAQEGKRFFARGGEWSISALQKEIQAEIVQKGRKDLSWMTII